MGLPYRYPPARLPLVRWASPASLAIPTPATRLDRRGKSLVPARREIREKPTFRTSGRVRLTFVVTDPRRLQQPGIRDVCAVHLCEVAQAVRFSGPRSDDVEDW